jgi:polysaccharide export outer membrane protein
VSVTITKAARFVAFAALVLALVSCGLPRSGPNKREIFSSSVQRQGDAFVVTVNERVIQATSVTPAIGLSQSFQKKGRITSDLIRPGDRLNLTIWEVADVPLLAGVGQNATVLADVQVDGSGHIFVPYAGRIRAAGNTPDQLRKILTTKLDAQTPDPQVAVTRVAGDGASVSVMGGVGGQGVYPIEGATRTLTAMLARAGGVAIAPEIAQIKLIRGSETGVVWLQDLYSNPKFDIALRPGDRILVEADSRSFTALGATGTQTRIPFDTQKLSLIEAIAQVGGLASSLADPTGVFVFRDEPPELANLVLGRNDLTGFQRFVYVLDLTEPSGMFRARDFLVRDGDTVYVTEAPFVQWNKTLSVLSSGVAAAGTLSTAANPI